MRAVGHAHTHLLQAPGLQSRALSPARLQQPASPLLSGRWCWLCWAGESTQTVIVLWAYLLWVLSKPRKRANLVPQKRTLLLGVVYGNDVRTQGKIQLCKTPWALWFPYSIVSDGDFLGSQQYLIPFQMRHLISVPLSMPAYKLARPLSVQHRMRHLQPGWLREYFMILFFLFWWSMMKSLKHTQKQRETKPQELRPLSTNNHSCFPPTTTIPRLFSSYSQHHITLMLI